MTMAPTWKSCERGLLERLRYDFSSREFRVEGTVEGRQHRIVGRYSGVARQLDVAIYQADASCPFFVADAKFHEDSLDVGNVDAFVGLMDDVGAITGLLATPKGPSPGAIQRAAAAKVTVWVMSLDEAMPAASLSSWKVLSLRSGTRSLNTSWPVIQTRECECSSGLLATMPMTSGLSTRPVFSASTTRLRLTCGNSSHTLPTANYSSHLRTYHRHRARFT